MAEVLKRFVILPLLLETRSVVGGTTWKKYGYIDTKPGSPDIAKIASALDHACEPCLLKKECLPTRQVSSNGAVISLTAKETFNPECGISKIRGVSLNLDLSKVAEPHNKSPLARILGI